MNVAGFGSDPFWLICLKVLGVFVLLVLIVLGVSYVVIGIGLGIRDIRRSKRTRTGTTSDLW